MKKRNLVAALIIAPVIFSSCKKSCAECDLMPAKIIRYDCDRVIFQLLTDAAIGDPYWEDIQTGQKYTNVVSYFNTCKISEITNGEKTTLYVNLKEPEPIPGVPDCYQCLAVSQEPPQTMVDFGEITESPCQSPGTR